jgi:hypothetical protein
MGNMLQQVLNTGWSNCNVTPRYRVVKVGNQWQYIKRSIAAYWESKNPRWSKQRALRSTKVQGVQESGAIEDGGGWDSLKGSNSCTLRTEW